MATLTHRQVADRFKSDLADLCNKHNIIITSASDIFVEIPPVYNPATNLYSEFGAEFNIGTRFDKNEADKIKLAAAQEEKEKICGSHSR